MSYREIADATGQTVATVISRLSMARKGLESATYADNQGTPMSIDRWDASLRPGRWRNCH